jgi:hypothetical protein
MNASDVSGKAAEKMNSMLVDAAGLLAQGWIWGVIGIVLGALAEQAFNSKSARARASKPRRPR